MATLTFARTSGAVTCTSVSSPLWCSGLNQQLAGVELGKGTVGGTLTGVVVSLGGEATNQINLMVECDPGVGNWASGDYVVTVNVTASNMNLTFNEIHICRLNSGCTNQATVGSLTGIARGLGSTGSQDHTVSGSAQGSATSTDRLVVLLSFTNTSMTSQSATMEVTVTTPIESAATKSPPPFGARYRPHFVRSGRRYV